MPCEEVFIDFIKESANVSIYSEKFYFNDKL